MQVYSRAALSGCSCERELYSDGYSYSYGRQSKPKVEIAIVPEKGTGAFGSAIVWFALLDGATHVLFKILNIILQWAMDGCDDLSICLMEWSI